MKHSEKLPGKTLAESLGLDIPDNAPGGSPLPYAPGAGAQRNSLGHKTGADLEYNGFSDNDAWSRGD